MSAHRISAIVTTFNRREQCKRAVLSALAQTRSPLEVLVCDNGSTDDTRRTVDELAQSDERVRYLALPTNTGSPAASRNLGLRAGRGDWVAFLDDDDQWLPEKLALQLPALSDSHSLVCANARRSDGREYFTSEDAEVTFGRKELLRDNPVITSTAVVNKERLLDAGGFPEDLRIVDDYGAWLALADGGATATRLPDVVALYETNDGDRLSATAASCQRAAASLALRRWKQRPFDRGLAMATIHHSVRAVKVSSPATVRRRVSAASSSTRS